MKFVANADGLSGTLQLGGKDVLTIDPNGALGGALPFSFRNKIINGNFDIWQRGTNTGGWVSPISNYYWADRWVFSSGGSGGNGSVSRQNFAAGQTAVPGEPSFFMSWQITTAASGQSAGSCFVEQRIEDVRTLAGRTATISFYAKGVGTLPSISLVQSFGSGGSALSVQSLASNVVLNAGWTKYTYTVNVNSISGKTIGSNHYVALNFNAPINSTYTLDIAQVQLEEGTVATPFEQRPIGLELALCRRYLRRIPWRMYFVAAASSQATISSFDVSEMFVTPAVTFSDVTSVNSGAPVPETVTVGAFKAINLYIVSGAAGVSESKFIIFLNSEI